MSVPEEPQAAELPQRHFRFPTAFTVLFLVLLLVWVAAFFVPAGKYQTKAGSPVPGTYHELPSCSAVAAGGAGTLVVPSPGETGTAPADAQQAPNAKVTPSPA